MTFMYKFAGVCECVCVRVRPSGTAGGRRGGRPTLGHDLRGRPDLPSHSCCSLRAPQGRASLPRWVWVVVPCAGGGEGPVKSEEWV